jgi:hypothetical protein
MILPTQCSWPAHRLFTRRLSQREKRQKVSHTLVASNRSTAQKKLSSFMHLAFLRRCLNLASYEFLCFTRSVVEKNDAPTIPLLFFSIAHSTILLITSSYDTQTLRLSSPSGCSLATVVSPPDYRIYHERVSKRRHRRPRIDIQPAQVARGTRWHYRRDIRQAD